MPISSTQRKVGPTPGNSTSRDFPFTFKVFAASDIDVIRTSANGGDTSLTQPSDYVVTLNPDQNAAPGGNVRLSEALPVGLSLTILSAVPITQLSNWQSQGGFNPDDLDDDLDRQTAVSQQLAEQLGRTLVVPATTSDEPIQMAKPVGDAILAWSADGTRIINLDPSALASHAAYSSSEFDVFTGDGVETIFNLSVDGGSLANLRVSIAGVAQTPGEDFQWNGGTEVEFAEAPADGLKIVVQYFAVMASSGELNQAVAQAEAVGNAAGALSGAAAGTAAANVVVAGKADIDGENLNPATDGLAFNTVLESYRRPFVKPLMDFVTDINAADWKPYFDAAVDWAAVNAPSGVRFTLPRYVVPGGIPLSYVKPILSDGVYFVGKGRTIWTGTFAPETDPCDINLLPSGSNSVFKWGNNAFDPVVPAGFTQRGGGLEGVNIRGWDSTAWVIDTHGVINPQFKSLWLWVPFSGIRIRNGYDPELTDIHIEVYRNTGVLIDGTGEGTGPDYRAGRGDRGIARNVFIVGEGDDDGPISPNPAFAIRGYWHTFDGSDVRVVKGGGEEQSVFLGDRRNGDANQRPKFITMNNMQIDYVRRRCIDVDDAEDVWFNGALYLNGSPNEHLRVGANALGVHFARPRGYGSEGRMVTISGKNVNINGGDFRAWDNDGVSTEPCIYIEATANDVKIVGTTFGSPTSGSDTSAGKRAIYAPPEATGSLIVDACSFYYLANPPVDFGGMKFNSGACVTEDGPANVPMGASKLFLGSQDYLPGSHSLYAVGDVAMAHGDAAAFFNSYYDGANVRRVEATAAGYVRNEATGLGFYQGPTGTAGATFSANLVARLNVDGTFRVQTKLGVGRDAVVGASVIATVGDISIGGGAPTACFNLYYDGSAWKYLGNGPGFALRLVLDGSTPKMQVLTAPNNTGGPDAAATVSVVGYLAIAP